MRPYQLSYVFRSEAAEGLSPMERFMKMANEQLQAAQMHSMAADELSPLIPTMSNLPNQRGGLHSLPLYP